MGMYSKNPFLPSVRRDAAAFANRKGVRVAARHFGVSPGTITKWVKKAERIGFHPIPTTPSKPKTSPRALPKETVEAIIKERTGRNRCAEVVHQALLARGVVVSLSSVKRTLDRCHLRKKRSPWKRPHDYTEKPEATHPGALLQCDTVHIRLPDGSTLYVYTIIDLYSRWAYAEAVEKISGVASAAFVLRAQTAAPFRFEMVQTDNGGEFQKMFRFQLYGAGLHHRYARVRQSNDQAHIERFNRTVQEECLDRATHTLEAFTVALAAYLPYYNTERPHMGINFKTPIQMFPSS